MPEFAGSTVSKFEGKICPWGESARQDGWGVGGSALPGTSPTVWDGLTYSGGLGLFSGWWILRLRPAAERRMTALPEVFKFQIGVKGVISPVHEEQVLLIWLYLFLSSTKTEVGCELSHISHYIFLGVTGFAHLSSIHSQNDHPVTDTWVSFSMAYIMSFCKKGILAQCCRIHHWCKWIFQLHPSGQSI